MQYGSIFYFAVVTPLSRIISVFNVKRILDSINFNVSLIHIKLKE